MGAAIGEVLSLAAGSRSARCRSWLGAVVLLIAGPSAASSGGEPAAWVGWLKLVLGVLALLLAVRQWRSQPAEGAE
jgi:hypothetical protein